MSRRILLIIWALALTNIVFSQFPGNVELYQIQTGHYRIIFPQELSVRASSLAKFLEETYPVNSQTLNAYPGRLTIVLDNRSTVSNGYTALGPWHCFWYMTPYPQITLGITEWDKLLGLHEIRHNIQYTALDHNFNKILHILDGQWGLAGGIGWSIPFWFMEGDAEFQETVMSNSGRGRVGRFAMPVKAITLNYPAKDLNYYKFFYRSYKRFYPNHYYLGYYMVTYVNRHWGPQIWSNILYHSTNWAFLPNAMNLSLKKYTGLSYTQLFEKTFGELKRLWKLGIDSTYHNEIFTLSHRPRRTYTNYNNPFIINDSLVLTVKTGLDQLPTLILLNQNTGQEQKLRTISSRDIYYTQDLVTWSEIDPHPRWSEASFSNIYVYDLGHNKIRKITHKGRFFSPTLSPDTRNIACVELDYHLTPHINIISIKDKEILADYEFPQFEAIRFLRYTTDGQGILFAGSTKEGNGLFSFNLTNGVLDTIIKPTSDFIIEKPMAWKNYIIFTADISGTENIFAIDTLSKQIYQITYMPYGAIGSDIDPISGQMYLSNYTADGFDPAIVFLHNNHWKKVTHISQENYFVSEETKPLIKDLTSSNYTDTSVNITRYRRGLHLLYPHSWLWDIRLKKDSLDNASITLYSQDVLKELNLTLSSTYKNTGQITNSLKLKYSHFFPVFELNLRQTRSWTNDLANLYGEVDISMPVSLRYNIWSHYLEVKEKNMFIYNFNNSNILSALGFDFVVQNLKHLSYRDVESRLGQTFYFDYTQVLNASFYQYTGIWRFRLPGPLYHDVWKISVYDQHISGSNILPQKITLPTGYRNISYSDIQRVRIMYHLPLFYPDWGWKPVFNIKRVRARLFYDMALVDYATKYSSTGLQMLFDFNLFGFNIDLSAGIQFAYRLNDNRFVISPVIDYIPINF